MAKIAGNQRLDELRVQCVNLEREQEEYELRTRKLINTQEEREMDIRSELRQLEQLDADGKGDKEFQRLLDERRSILRKTNKDSEKLRSILGKRITETRANNDVATSDIRREIVRMEMSQ